MSEICTDNRFEVIAAYKKKLIESTNIETSPDEMAVIDNVLFRFWQMGWLPPVPHGRLIDADVLTELCRDMQSIEWNKHAAPYSWAYAYEDFENVILDAPTIIPAEKEEEHG